MHGDNFVSKRIRLVKIVWNFGVGGGANGLHLQLDCNMANSKKETINLMSSQSMSTHDCVACVSKAISILQVPLREFVRSQLKLKATNDVSKNLHAIVSNQDDVFETCNDKSLTKRCLEIRNQVCHQRFNKKQFKPSIESLVALGMLIHAKEEDIQLIQSMLDPPTTPSNATTTIPPKQAQVAQKSNPPMVPESPKPSKKGYRVKKCKATVTRPLGLPTAQTCSSAAVQSESPPSPPPPSLSLSLLPPPPLLVLPTLPEATTDALSLPTVHTTSSLLALRQQNQNFDELLLNHPNLAPIFSIVPLADPPLPLSQPDPPVENPSVDYSLVVDVVIASSPPPPPRTRVHGHAMPVQAISAWQRFLLCLKKSQ